MAGGSRKTRSSTPPPRAVEARELFPFKLDATPQIVVARADPQKVHKDRPHYHEHRARLRKKFDEAGPAALADYELLEASLFRTIPRQDTKPLAKPLLTKFGSLNAVLAAPAQRIAKSKAPAPPLRRI